MASTYTTTLGVEKMGAGDQSGTWGTTSNFNWDIIDRLIGYSSVTVGSTSHTLTIRDAAPSSGSSNVQTLTIAPATATAYFIVRNGLSASRSVIFTQGAGAATFTLPNGKDAIIWADGSDEVHSAMTNPQFTTIDTTGAANVQGALTLGTDLTVPNGGTGASTFTAKGILYGQGTSALLVTAAGTENQLLQANGSGVPGFATVTGLNPAGTIVMFAATSAPTGYLPCDGAAISRTTYAALFSAISTSYGAGDGSSTFNVPNLQGKFPIGYDGGSSYGLAATGGATSASYTPAGTNSGTALTEANLPAHTHDTWGNTWPTGSWTGGTGTTQSSVTQTGGSLTSTSTLRTLATGSGTTHTHTFAGTAATIATLSPYLVTNYIIKT